MQVHRGVEPGLPAQRRQERIGAFLLDDLGDDFPGDRLHVGAIRGLRIGHDGRGIGIDEDNGVAFFAQGFAGLRPGVIELARLPDDDGPGADEQNFLEIGAFRHCQMVSKKQYSPSLGGGGFFQRLREYSRANEESGRKKLKDTIGDWTIRSRAGRARKCGGMYINQGQTIILAIWRAASRASMTLTTLLEPPSSGIEGADGVDGGNRRRQPGGAGRQWRT